MWDSFCWRAALLITITVLITACFLIRWIQKNCSMKGQSFDVHQWDAYNNVKKRYLILSLTWAYFSHTCAFPSNFSAKTIPQMKAHACGFQEINISFMSDLSFLRKLNLQPVASFDTPCGRRWKHTKRPCIFKRFILMTIQRLCCLDIYKHNNIEIIRTNRYVA